MKKIGAVLMLFLLAGVAQAQIVRIEPSDADGDQEIRIIYDATQGTAGLVGESKVYMHSGVIIDGPDGEDWTNVVGNWGQDDGVGEMTPVAGQTDLWEITLTPTARDYYSVPQGTTMFRLSMVFRNADGSAEGKGNPGPFEGGTVGDNRDIYVDLNVGEFITITSPRTNETVEEGNTLTLSATASNEVSAMAILLDEGNGFNQLASVSSGTQISFVYTPTQSFQGQLKVTATIGGQSVESSQELNVTLIDDIPEMPLPVGL